MTKRQRTLDEAQWDALMQAHEKAPHGYKNKAAQRLKDFVRETLKRDNPRTESRSAA